MKMQHVKQSAYGSLGAVSRRWLLSCLATKTILASHNCVGIWSPCGPTQLHHFPPTLDGDQYRKIQPQTRQGKNCFISKLGLPTATTWCLPQLHPPLSQTCSLPASQSLASYCSFTSEGSRWKRNFPVCGDVREEKPPPPPLLSGCHNVLSVNSQESFRASCLPTSWGSPYNTESLGWGRGFCISALSLGMPYGWSKNHNVSSEELGYFPHRMMEEERAPETIRPSNTQERHTLHCPKPPPLL